MIEIKDLSFSYGKHSVLEHVSFQVSPGECVGILGNNGAGKSTLITCINRIRLPKTGQVRINGQDIFGLSRNALAKKVAYVAQKNEMTNATVFDCVLLGRTPYIKWSVGQKDLELCEEMISLVGISHLKLRNVDQLSGGELQKVMLARALVQQPELLLLDEPTSNLDSLNEAVILKSLKEEKKDKTIVLVSHRASTMRIVDQMYSVEHGRLS